MSDATAVIHIEFHFLAFRLIASHLYIWIENIRMVCNLPHVL